MKKRGQTTLFIILGIIVLIISSFVYYAYTSVSKEKTIASTQKMTREITDVVPIKQYAESCLKKVSDEGLWLIGAQGGYIDTTSISTTSYLGYSVPYYIDYVGGTSSSTPLLLDIEEKLSNYVDSEFKKCFNLDIFNNAGFDITETDIALSNITINQDNVIVRLEYPLTITKKDSETKLKDFRINLPIRLGRLYNASINLTEEIRNRWDNGESFDLNSVDCDLYDPLNQTNIYAKNNDYPDSNIKIIQIMDYNPFYHKYLKTYIFQFAIRKDPIDFTGGMCKGTFI